MSRYYDENYPVGPALTPPPKVVTVIPTYNRAPTIVKAVRSAIQGANTFVLVVDDGSGDGTIEVLRREFPDVAEYPRRWAPVKVVEQEHIGLHGKVRNHGVDRIPWEFPWWGDHVSRGGEVFVTHLDSDDYMAPGRLEQAKKLLWDPPLPDVVIGCQRPFLRPGCEWPPWVQEHEREATLPYIMSAMARWEFWMENPWPDLKVLADLAWAIETLPGSKTVQVTDVWVHRMIHDDQLTADRETVNAEFKMFSS